MNDGGGIHTIGRSRNTSINGNYFHDLAAGNSGEVSQFAQVRVYEDARSKKYLWCLTRCVACSPQFTSIIGRVV